MTRTVRIILHRNSACSSVAKGIYNSAGVVQFSSASTSAAACADVPWTVRNICRDGFQGTCPPGYACRILSARKAAVFYDNDVDATFAARRQGGCYSKSSMWLLPATVDSPQQISN